jgi:hypothetical protein
MSSAVAAVLRPVPMPGSDVLRRDLAAQALRLRRPAFTVAPILFGLDKFAPTGRAARRAGPPSTHPPFKE